MRWILKEQQIMDRRGYRIIRDFLLRPLEVTDTGYTVNAGGTCSRTFPRILHTHTYHPALAHTHVS